MAIATGSGRTCGSTPLAGRVSRPAGRVRFGAVGQRRAPLRQRVALTGALLVLALGLSSPPALTDSEVRRGDEGRSGWNPSLFPALFYSPETGFGGGGGLILTHHPARGDPGGLPNTVSAVLLYTVKHQATIAIQPDFADARNRWRVRGYLLYRNFPANFYGVGNDTREEDEEDFTTEDVMFQPWLLRSLTPGLRLGVIYDLRRSTVLERKPDGLLRALEEAGLGGGRTSGLGPVFEWDGRDNLFYPTRGFWAQAIFAVYRGALGSEFDYESYILDLRRYIPLGQREVLALHAYASERRGQVPAFDLNPLGEVLRGVDPERYRDRAIAVAQVEYRFPLVGRFRGAIFAAAGEVAPKLSRLDRRGLHTTGGLGFRFVIDERDQTAVRFDIGIGEESSQIYFQFGEAF